MSKPEKINPKLESINYNNLEIREDIIYLKNSDTPYTGKASSILRDKTKGMYGQTIHLFLYQFPY